MGDTNEQLSGFMTQLTMINFRLEEQNKEIKALREKLTEEEVYDDAPHTTSCQIQDRFKV